MPASLEKACPPCPPVWHRAPCTRRYVLCGAPTAGTRLTLWVCNSTSVALALLGGNPYAPGLLDKWPGQSGRRPEACPRYLSAVRPDLTHLAARAGHPRGFPSDSQRRAVKALPCVRLPS